MKYYHKIYKWDDGKEKVRNYDERDMPPSNKPIWGFSYDINDDTKQHRLICKPIMGEIIEDKWKKNFVPYKKNGKDLRESGRVNINSRYYADTEEEAIEMYNELVHKRIYKLQEMIEEAKGDLI